MPNLMASILPPEPIQLESSKLCHRFIKFKNISHGFLCGIFIFLFGNDGAYSNASDATSCFIFVLKFSVCVFRRSYLMGYSDMFHQLDHLSQ